MEPNIEAPKPKKKKPPKIARTALRNLKPGAVIDWQGKPHRVHGVALDGNGSARVTLSWTIADPEEGILFKASAFDAYRFTTREIAQTIRVDRYVEPNKPKASGKPAGNKGKPAKGGRKAA